ncbi:MAG TPA: DUF6064 family protein [Balneolaceae bacterium]|nr:DUF6064 family protein [Balneolaceae bacterium]
MPELPFTTEQFLEIFRSYNLAIWPAQIFAYLLGLGAIILAIRKIQVSDKLVSFILGIFWLWMGIAYHLLFFSRINEAALLFGGIFIIQGVLFIAFGMLTNKLRFHFQNNIYGIAGILLISYAMIIYPFIGTLSGHGYPYAPMFGIAPCPTVIYTFGLLLWTQGKVPAWLLVVPALWSLVGFSAALQLDMPEDFGLIAAGIFSVTMLTYRNHIHRQGSSLRMVK